jgi:hypothetical protein
MPEGLTKPSLIFQYNISPRKLLIHQKSKKIGKSSETKLDSIIEILANISIFNMELMILEDKLESDMLLVLLETYTLED